MELIIHVGLPKTATTTIQDSLSKDSSINYLNLKANKYLSLINNADEKLFNKRFSDLEDQIALLFIPHKINVISYESFTDVITPLFTDNYINHRCKMIRLYKLFGEYEPKIIITIRNQVDLFYSSYVQGISEGWDYDNYQKLLKNLLNNKKSVYDLNEIINMYNKKFNNVAIVCYEMVYQDQYFSKLSKEFKIPIENRLVNQRKKMGGNKLSREVTLSQYFKLKYLVSYNNIVLKLSYKFIEKILRFIKPLDLTHKKSLGLEKLNVGDSKELLKNYKKGNKKLIKYIDKEIVKKYYIE